MAFDVEEYAKKRKQNSTTESDKNGNKKSTFDVEEYAKQRRLPQVAEYLNSAITNWVKQNESFYAGYNDKIGQYQDKDILDWAYDSGSADWLSSLTTQRGELDSSADEILSIINDYGKYLGKDYVSSVLEAVNGNRSQYDSILSYATDLNKHWSSFETEDAYKSWVAEAKADAAYEGWFKNVDPDKAAQGWEKYLVDDEERKNTIMYGEEDEKWYETLGRWFGSGGAVDTTLPTSGVTQAINGLREDDSYRRPNDDWTEEQKKVFGELYADSPNAAFMFAEETNIRNNKKKEEDAIKGIQDSATSGFWAGAGHTLGAIVTAPFGLADYLNDIAMMSAGRPVSPDGYVSPFEYSQAVTSGISTKLNEQGGTLDENIPIIGGKGWGDVYGLGTSIAQSITSAYTLGGAGTLVSYFGQGAAAGVDDALSRGATEGQALLYGASLGVFEGVAESIGVERLLKIGSANTLKGLLLNVAKQSGAEGIEEGLTALLGNIADNVIMQDKSNFNAMVAKYKSQGMSESEAKEKAWWESVEGIAFDTIAGAVSGGVSGGLHTTVQSIGHNIETTKQGQDIIDRGGVDALKQLALDMSGVTQGADSKKLTKLAGKVDTKTSARNVGKLSDFMGSVVPGQTRSEIEASLTNKGFSQTDAKEIAEYLHKLNQGYEFSDEEIKKITDKFKGFKDGIKISQVLTELSDPKSSINKWDRDFLLARLGISSKTETTEAPTLSESEQKDYISAVERIASEVATGSIPTKTGRFIQGQVDSERERVNSISVEAAERLGVEGRYTSNETGVTRLASNKHKVDIVGIDSIKDGVMKVKLNDGSIVNAEEINFSTSDEALVYEAVTNMGVSPTTAWEIIKAYDPKSGQSGTIYAMGALEAYTYGHNGVKIEGMSQDGFSALLSPVQKNTAHRLGGIDAMAKVEAQQKTIDKARDRVRNNAKILHKPVAKRKGGVVLEGIESTSLTNYQESQIEVLGKVAEGLGVTFHIFESDENFKYTMPDGTVRSANGWYNPKTGEIWIDLKAGNFGQGTIIFTAAHELTHFIKQWSPAKFKVFADFLFEQYGKQGETLEQLIRTRMEALKANGRTNGKSLTEIYDLAYEEIVADSAQAFLRDSKAAEKIAALREKDAGLANKIKTFLAQMLVKMRKVLADAKILPESTEAGIVAEMTDSIQKLYDLWTDALADAGRAYSMLGGEIDLDGDSNSHIMSDRTMVEGAGLQFVIEEDGIHYKVLDADGNPVKSVTPEAIANSPLGQLVASAKDNKFLGEGREAELAAKKQYKFLAELVNMCIKYDGLAPVWEVAGTMVFSSIKSNADKQYGLTIDFSTVCKKTQAIVDAMSEAMVRLGRGLTRSEVETIYLEVGKAGESTPCPVCYVFSRWMGIGGILDQMSRFQDKYINMSDAELQAFIADIKGRIAERANTPGKDGTLKKAFFDKNGEIKEGQVIADLKQKANSGAGSTLNAITKNSDILLEIQQLQELMKRQDAKEAKKTATKIKKLEAKLVDVTALEKQFKEFNDIVEEYEAYQWLTRTLMKEVNGEWVRNTEFKAVPKDVLFDLNKGATFAEDYPLSWAFRTGKGASAGKAITPYADARVGEAIQGVAAQGVKDIKTGLDLNPFLNGDTKTRERIIASAIEKQARQNLIGGQRYQSTSDFRYEYGSDYLITFLEMQAIGAKVQLYTKVIEAVDFLASMGADINLSVMPLSDGYITLPDGTKKLIYSSVTGIDAEAAIKKSHEYNNVQLILVGISDEHIRLALEGEDVTFVIPFHGSGNTVHQIQVLMNLLGENLDVTTAQDYTAVQSDHVSPKQTKEQKAVWDLRVKILTGKASTLSAKEIDILNKNAFLKDLYERFYVNENAEEFGIALTSDVAGQIFPYEYWDKSLTYAEADKNGERFKEYCASMGIIPRFSGMNSKGENVGFGDFTNNKGYWKLLIDRPMYDNVYDADGNWIGYGNYHEQQRINCYNFQVKHLDPAYGSATYGEVMSKANDPKKTNMIVDRAIAQFEKFSDRGYRDNPFVAAVIDTDTDYQNKGMWSAKAISDMLKQHPEYDFLRRVYKGDNNALEELRTIVESIDDVNLLENIAYYPVYTYNTDSRKVLRKAINAYKKIVNTRIQALMEATVQGTDVGMEIREYSLDEIRGMFDSLNTNKDIAKLAEKVFALAKRLDLDIKGVRSIKQEANTHGASLFEQVVFRVPYFNDKAVSNQAKAGVLLHELIHSCTTYAIRAVQHNRTLDESTRRGVLMLENIYNQIKSDPLFKDEYGIKSVGEMVAELSNTEFRDKLQKRNLWQRIIDAIKSLLGIQTKTGTTLEGAEIALNYVLDNFDAWAYELYVDEYSKANRANDHMLFSDRSTPTSTRSLLAGALETTAQNDIERTKLAQYKEKITLIEAEYARLEEIRAELKKLYFPGKGTHRDTARITALQFEANQIANRINVYDRQLLNLEATTALRNVLQREKKMVYDKITSQAKKDSADAFLAGQMSQGRKAAMALRRANEALARQRERQAQTVRTIMDRNAESRKRATEGRHETEMRHKIKKVVGDLKALLLNPTKEKHVPIGLQKPVAEALDIINMDTVGAEERIAKLKGDLMKAKTPEEIQEISRKIDRIQLQGENLAEKLTALKLAYAEIKNSDDPLVRDSHDESIENLIADTADKVGSTSIRDMSLEQLEAVYDMYKAILATVRNANKMFKAEKQETITANSEWAKREISAVGGHRNRVLKATKFLKKFGWNMLKPIYAMKLIGSDTITRLYENVRKGEDTWAVDVNEAKVFFKETASKYHYNSWDFKKQYTFKDSAGHTFSLTLEQLMSLYAYSKREQADKHLELGGFVFDDAIEVVEKNKLGIPVTYEVNDANPYRLKKDALGEIISILDTDALKDVKGFVDEMQAYLSDVMGAKGNEVSLAMYDIKLFKEKHYFPLKSSKYFREFDPEKSGTPRIKNSGFSKKTTPGAGNPIILSNFMDVWANHVNDMSMYHAFVLPLEDFMRVYNYSSTAGGYDSVQQYIKNAYGAQANTYIETLMNDLNGGVRTDPATDLIGKGMALFKKAAVFLSASVVIQQPSAIARALAYIDAKYFVDKPEATKHSETWAEVKKYAPVAIIKEMGYFDTNMGRSTVDWIKDEKTWRDKIDALASKAPAFADELAWCAIWKAVKREVADSTNLQVGSEEFLKMAGKRFTEVITRTQVYDSVLSRSALMRSKDTGAKMITAFMAEPTTSLNMAVDAIIEGKRGNKKFAWKAVGAVAASIILNSILVSLVYAARDDDEDETYTEKYLESLTTELIDGFNPITYIPLIKDIWSIMQGFDVERSDMSIWSDLWASVENMFDDKKSGWEKTEGIVGSIASIFGVPAKNLMRDARGLYNLVTTLLSGTPTTKAGVGEAIGGAFKSSIPLYNRIERWAGADKSKSDNLYDAIISGDQNHIDRVKAQYKDDKAIESAIKQGLRENDSRIKEAAKAHASGDIRSYSKYIDTIASEGHFDKEMVESAIRSEESAFNTKINEAAEAKNKGEDAEYKKIVRELRDSYKGIYSQDDIVNLVTKAQNEQLKTTDDDIEEVTSVYKASDVNAAFESGDSEMALEVIDELFNTKVENYLAEARRDAEKEGKRFNERTARKEAETKAKSSIKSSMTSYWKPLYKEAYKSGNTAEKERIERILKTSGLYGSASEVIKTCREWRTER